LVVVSVIEPDYKRNFIDRVFVAVERENLLPVLVFNKVDLADARYLKVVKEDARVYERLGYKSVLVSAETGEGLDVLRGLLREKISVVTGPGAITQPSCQAFDSDGDEDVDLLDASRFQRVFGGPQS
jgi:ribosome biogenesis GTPase